MERPAVVGLDERPVFGWQPDLDWIAVDVIDRALDLVRMIEKNFPTATSGPDRMVRSAMTRDPEFLTTG